MKKSTERLDAVLSVARFASLAALLQSLLAIYFWTAVELPGALCALGIVIAMATLPFAWAGFSQGRDRRASLIAVFGMAVTTAIVVFKMIAVGWLWHERVLHSAMLSLPASALFMAGIARFQAVGPARAFFVAIPVALFGAVAWENSNIVRHLMPTTVHVSEWSYPVHVPDDVLENRCIRYGVQKSYYPDNPRGTFENEPRDGGLDMRLWRLMLFGGAKAAIDRADAFWSPSQVTISDLGDDGGIMGVQIAQRVPVTSSRSYVFQARLRSPVPRVVLVRISPMGSESILGEARSHVHRSDCEICVPFQAPADVERVDIHVGLGGALGEVQVNSACLQHLHDSIGDLRSWSLESASEGRAWVEEWWNDCARIRMESGSGAPVAAVRFKRKLAGNRAGDSRLSFKLRSDSQREIRVSVAAAPEALVARLAIGTDWTGHEVVVPADASVDQVILDVGGANGWVEIRDVDLIGEEGDRAESPGPVMPERYSMLYELNAEGYRDHDHPVEPPSDTFRIALLGDSMVFGQGVRVGERFGDLVEARLGELRQQGQPAVEVMNFGVCGYATWQERLCYEHVASKYDPKLVLISVFENDPQSYLQERATFSWQKQRHEAGLLGFWSGLDPPTPGPTDYESCEEELVRLAESCEKNGDRLAVVFFRYDESPDWKKLMRVIPRRLRRLGIPYIDVGDELCRRYTLKEMVVHPVDLHPNELAHSSAAEVIVPFLLELELVPRDSREEVGVRR